MRVAAVIPARGGSKGIPLKNLQEIGGKPLLVWAITAAAEVVGLDNVFVTTEDPAIARIAFLSGAKTIDRPPELATDTAMAVDAYCHAVERIRDDYDIVIALECTGYPMRSSDIKKSIATLIDMEADSTIAVQSDVLFLWRLRPDGFAAPVNQIAMLNRQQADEEYRLLGHIRAVRIDQLLKTRQLVTGRVALVEISGKHVDIDEIEDLRYANWLHDREQMNEHMDHAG